MSTHAVSTDAYSARIDLVGIGRKDGLGEFLGDVCVHLVVLGPRVGGGIDIKAGS